MKNVLFIIFIGIISACNNVNSSTEKKSEIINKENKEFISKIELSNIKYKSHGEGTRAASIYGPGVTFFFTVKNNSSVGIKSIYLNGTFKFDGRSYEYSEEMNYEFQKGLESGETQEVAMKPGPFSKWNEKIHPGDNGKLYLNVLEIIDYNNKSTSIKD